MRRHVICSRIGRVGVPLPLKALQICKLLVPPAELSHGPPHVHARTTADAT